MSGECPHQSVHSRRVAGEEIPGTVVSSGRLRNFIVWTGLNGVDQVGELNCVLNEENGNVVSNNVYLNVSDSLKS